jgi:hypothetical protein
MIFYKLDYAIEETLKQNLTTEQIFLRKFTGAGFEREEARRLCERINDHKWYISEKLGRDVGLNVAAIDYLENIYQSSRRESANSRFGGRRRLNLAARGRLALLA